MIINHNMASLNTYRQLSANNTNSAKSLEKLSSGLRINRAGDDAAGLAISEKMRGQIRGLDQAARNAQDSISMIQTAEGSLNETHSILQRMKELATQAANDTNVNADRSEIQKEINQLTSEINRIGNTTEFNTQKLLDGGGKVTAALSPTTTTAGAVKGAVSVVSENVMSVTGRATGSTTYNAGAETITITADDAGTALNGKTVTFTASTVADAAVAVTTDAGGNITITYGDNATVTDVNNAIDAQGSVPTKFKIASTEAAGALDEATLTAVTVAFANGGDEVKGNYSFDITSAFADAGDTFDLALGNGNTIAINGGDEFTAGQTAEEQATAIAAALNLNGSFSSDYTATTVGSKVVFTEIAGQAQGAKPTISGVSTTAKTGDYDLTITDKLDVGGKYTIDGQDILVTDDTTNAGLAKGTAILAGSTAAEQAANLKTAIELNTTLNVKYDVSGSAGATINLVQQDGYKSSTAPSVTTTNDATEGFEAKFQIGANTAQSMTININDMRSAALKISGTTSGDTIKASNGTEATLKTTKEVTNGTDNSNTEYALDVSSHDKATAAISVLGDAIQTVSAERSKLGAYQNRLEHTINNLGTSSENLTAAESRIRDVDMAKEMMNFQKNNILSQAAQAMLAQANQAPQGVLQLLR